MTFEVAGTDFGALQVLQYADGLALVCGGAPQGLNACGVQLMRPMGKIQPGDVHAKLEQGLNSGLVRRGRAQGADDFGPSEGCISGGTQERTARILNHDGGLRYCNGKWARKRRASRLALGAEPNLYI